MGEVSQLKAVTPKPRPLGFVKRESVHFEDAECNSSPQILDHVNGDFVDKTFYFQGRSKTDVDFRQDVRSMRDLQETLRQAALLKIVAAVNNESGISTAMPSKRMGIPQTPGIKGGNLLSLTGADNNKLTIGHAGSTDHQAGIFSRHLHNVVSHSPSTPVAPPNTALSQLLGYRQRTATSIPRPRTHGEQTPFMHSNLLDAKEQLANMTSFRASTKFEPGDNTLATLLDLPVDVKSPERQIASTNVSLQIGKPGEVSTKPTDTSNGSHYALRGTSHPREDGGPKTESGGAQNTDQNSKMTKDEQRAHNVYQMQMLKRHISTSKKREMVKKLTELSKCEAVDMNEAVDGEVSGPIIILAQSKNNSQMEYGSPEYFDNANIVRRRQSTCSLHEQIDGDRVPNTRVQSETMESIKAYREAKQPVLVNSEENLRIGVKNTESVSADIYTKLEGLQNDTFSNGELYHQFPDVSTWVRDHRHNSFFIKGNLQSTPDLLELRPLATSPLQPNKNASDKKRILISRRGVNPVLRDKLVSPSPVVYEASFHRPKASMGQMSLVGQSLPSLPVSKPSVLNSKRHIQDDTKAPSRSKHVNQDEDFQPVRLWNDSTDRPSRVLKPWGSTVKQTTSDSPILRTEILDHLQCVGIVDRRPTFALHKRNQVHEDSDDDSTDDEEGQLKKNALYRQSKLYSAFRASEENLANLTEDVSSLVSDTLTTRSLLNQPGYIPLRKMEPTLPPPPPSREATAQPNQVEPRAMGCTSRVSDNETRSQFHFANNKDEAESKQGGNFKVFKALDQDVYFDFQHKKYRNTKESTTPLNTNESKPRMHYIKIKYTGETRT